MDRLSCLVVVASLLLAGAVSAQVHTAALPPTAVVQAERPRLADDWAAVVLYRALRDELIDADLSSTSLHYRLPLSWARIAGGATPVPAVARHLSCSLTADVFDLAVGIDLGHPRGWGGWVKVDLDDHRVVVEAAANGLHYGVTYDQGGTVQALLRMPF